MKESFYQDFTELMKSHDIKKCIILIREADVGCAAYDSSDDTISGFKLMSEWEQDPVFNKIQSLLNEVIDGDNLRPVDGLANYKSVNESEIPRCQPEIELVQPQQ